MEHHNLQRSFAALEKRFFSAAIKSENFEK
jgi:hypothetical protein